MSSSNEPKLVLHFHQMVAFKDILFESKERYRKLYGEAAYQNPLYLSEISTAFLYYFILDEIYKKVLDRLELKRVIYKFPIDKYGCFCLLSSILPVNNNEWNVRVKEIVLDYCVKKLKYLDLLPNMPTYRPALPDLKAEFVNPTTQLWEYLEE